jgi:hypothetical protein
MLRTFPRFVGLCVPLWLLALFPHACWGQVWPSSSVLSKLSDLTVAEFAGKLALEWLPKPWFGARLRVSSLLYRGSRDGMTAQAFHSKCDGQGPTLVLIRAQSPGFPPSVFGGFAGKSWESAPAGVYVDARDSFVFSLSNPAGSGVVKAPVVNFSMQASKAMWCRASCGPVFGNGHTIAIRNCTRSPTGEFDISSYCDASVDDTFGDPIRLGRGSFTGSQYFVPFEVEVWRIGA